MKTFEEAVMASGAPVNSPTLDAAIKVAMERASRYTDILDEISASPLTDGILAAMRQALGFAPDCPCEACGQLSNAMKTAYVNGRMLIRRWI
jgi:hypothetical protein